MKMRLPELPYFDDIFARIAEDPDSELVEAFGTRHVHWGYYDDADSRDTSTRGLVVAAEALTRRMTDSAGVGDGLSILDAGCGFGGTLASLDERFSRVRLTGLNIDARQLERASGLLAARPGNSIDWVQGDACDMPFAAGSFDVILAVECIFHFPSRTRFFREVRRVLRPGGRLVLSDFVPHGPSLPALVPWGLYHGRRITSFFGRRNPVLCTRLGYHALARLAGLTLAGDEDVTEHTLPTYGVLRRMLRTTGRADAERATELMEWVSRRGWIRYRLLEFVRAE
jgi:SAM-dependent methyltransferase